MTDDQILEVVQAHKEGKKIQFKYGGMSQWQNDPTGFDFINARYRIAPEPRKPREWSVVLNREGDIIAVAIYKEGHEVIRVREVID